MQRQIDEDVMQDMVSRAVDAAVKALSPDDLEHVSKNDCRQHLRNGLRRAIREQFDWYLRNNF